MYKLRCGFKTIVDSNAYFKSAIIKKGEPLAAHVHCVQQIVEEDSVFVKSKCVSQVRNIVYDVEFEVICFCHFLAWSFQQALSFVWRSNHSVCSV